MSRSEINEISTNFGVLSPEETVWMHAMAAGVAREEPAGVNSAERLARQADMILAKFKERFGHSDIITENAHSG